MTWRHSLYRCVSCHREASRPSLVTYAAAAKRARLSPLSPRSAIRRRGCHPLPGFNTRGLTAAEIALLASWAAAGAPEGNPRETPPPPKAPEGWPLGKPDLEAAMPTTFTVPADGPDLYQCFVIPAPAPADHWVRAIDVSPGNAKVVHHVIVFQDTTRTARKRDTGEGYSCFGTPGFLPARGLGGWTPGSLPFRMPDDIPSLYHGNSDLVLQIHYHPTGKPETDRTRLALYYASQPPARRLMDIPLGSNRIDIAPGDATVKVTYHFTIPVEVDAIGIIPHAHYVCKTMYVRRLPDGTRRTLLRIPDWNFNWQRQYRYAPHPPARRYARRNGIHLR